MVGWFSKLIPVLLLLSGLGCASGDSRALLSGRCGSKSKYSDRVLKEDLHAEAETCFHTSECQILHLYKVVRHGTRFPTEKHIRKMSKVADVFGWPIPFDSSDAGLLAREGEQELFEMGKRTRERFLALFDRIAYHPSRFEFRSSQVTRALQSAAAFSHGLFHEDGDDRPYEHVAIVSETKELDRLLRFHKACPAYITGVKKNATLKTSGDHVSLEAVVFDKVFATLLARVDSQRDDSASLKPKLIELGAETVVKNVWDICMMEYAVHDRVSPYCALLGEEEVELLELIDDVSTFWMKGYGFPINYEMSCLLFSDMLETTLQASSEQSNLGKKTKNKLATFRFAHAETLIPLIARLGLFKDLDGKEKFSANETIDLDQLRSRKWRASSLVPFAANVALALYSCEGGENGERQMMVELLHNEHPVHLPKELCPQESRTTSTLCPLESFKQAVQHIADSCDFDSICNHVE